MVSQQCCEEIAVNLRQLHKGIAKIQGRMLHEHNVSFVEYHILMMIAKVHHVSQIESMENAMAKMPDISAMMAMGGGKMPAGVMSGEILPVEKLPTEKLPTVRFPTEKLPAKKFPEKVFPALCPVGYPPVCLPA